MEKIELQLKEYSTKKLKEIIETQSNAYNEGFIDFSKNELIRRGETFTFNAALQKEVEQLPDEELKKIIEIERESYHLEYLEVAIKEYLKRGFKNETGYSYITPPTDEKKLIENKIRTQMIPPTLWVGIVSAIAKGAYLYAVLSDAIGALTVVVLGIGSVLALCLLLETLSEALSLLRRIADRN